MYTKGSLEKPKSTRYQVKVIEGKCIGAASCAAIAAKTYWMNKQDLAEIIDQDGDSDDDKLLGAQSCPTNAIEVIDTKTGKKVWPI